MQVNRLTDQKHLRESQYANADQLNARMRLHELFTVTETPWFTWLNEKINLQAGERVLELGCGSGDLWLSTRQQQPEGVQYFLSDFSSGMLRTARERIEDRSFDFTVMDAQQIGIPADTFDVVIANHMLYHVPDIAIALREIRRVLKPGGRLIAATNGEGHLAGIYELLHRFDSSFPIQRSQLSFSLENGQDWLGREFNHVSCIRHDAALHVRDIHPLLDYYASMQNLTLDFEGVDRSALADFLDAYLNAHEIIIIKKAAGVLIAS